LTDPIEGSAEGEDGTSIGDDVAVMNVGAHTNLDLTWRSKGFEGEAEVLTRDLRSDQNTSGLRMSGEFVQFWFATIWVNHHAGSGLPYGPEQVARSPFVARCEENVLRLRCKFIDLSGLVQEDLSEPRETHVTVLFADELCPHDVL
jgi:hypothetical protein